MPKQTPQSTRNAIRLEANSLVAYAVRNGTLEHHHSGVLPHTKTGDYSDVKVVTPLGEIPWNEVSRINDAEMKDLMINITESLARVLLLRENDPAAYRDFLEIYSRAYADGWVDTPPTDDDAAEIPPLIEQLKADLGR